MKIKHHVVVMMTLLNECEGTNMKASLEFDLPEQSEEFYDALDGHYAKRVVNDILEFLRRELKYNSDNLSEEQVHIYQKIRDEVVAKLEEYEVKL